MAVHKWLPIFAPQIAAIIATLPNGLSANLRRLRLKKAYPGPGDMNSRRVWREESQRQLAGHAPWESPVCRGGCGKVGTVHCSACKRVWKRDLERERRKSLILSSACCDCGKGQHEVGELNRVGRCKGCQKIENRRVQKVWEQANAPRCACGSLCHGVRCRKCYEAEQRKFKAANKAALVKTVRQPKPKQEKTPVAKPTTAASQKKTRVATPKRYSEAPEIVFERIEKPKPVVVDGREVVRVEIPWSRWS